MRGYVAFHPFFIFENGKEIQHTFITYGAGCRSFGCRHHC